MASSKREHLIDAALNLFCQRGFNATGIDTIIKEAGVAKMTLYKHFASKDDLVLSALRRVDEVFRHMVVSQVAKKNQKPSERVLAIFDVLHDWFESDNFYGCVFQKASSEYVDTHSPIKRMALEHKTLIMKYVEELLAEKDCKNCKKLAQQICYVIDGSIVWAQTTDRSEHAKTAKEMIRSLLGNQKNE